MLRELPANWFTPTLPTSSTLRRPTTLFGNSKLINNSAAPASSQNELLNQISKSRGANSEIIKRRRRVDKLPTRRFSISDLAEPARQQQRELLPCCRAGFSSGSCRGFACSVQRTGCRLIAAIGDVAGSGTRATPGRCRPLRIRLNNARSEIFQNVCKQTR